MGYLADETTVTAAICTYNRADVLAEAIESILAQTRMADEILVVDDGSTDETAAVAQRFGERVRYVRRENGGISAARNTVLQEATCRWVAFLDSDDLWIPCHLDNVFRILETNPQLVWGCSTRRITNTRDGVGDPITPPELVNRYVDRNGIVQDYFVGNTAAIRSITSCMVVRTSVMIEKGGFDPSLRTGEDVDMWCKIAFDHPQIAVAKAPGLISRQFRADSLTSQVSKAKTGERDKPLLALLQRHLDMAKLHGSQRSFRPHASHRCSGLATRAVRRGDGPVLRLMAIRYHRLLKWKLWAIVCAAALLSLVSDRTIYDLRIRRPKSCAE